MPVDQLMNLCLAIADGKVSLGTFHFNEVDVLHKRLQDIYEAAPLSSLLAAQFLNHMSIIRDMWEILARLSPCGGPLVLAVLRDNSVRDFVVSFSPILGTLLARVGQQVEGGALEGGDTAVCSLQELAVALLASLVSVAHFLFWQKGEATSLEWLCRDIHTAFSGRSLCSISNSPLLLTALLKASCCLQDYTTAQDSPSQRPFLSPGGAPSNFLSSPRSNGSSGAVRTHS
ncbi:hypothetical protein GBAR_LOCUS17487, partial [Geodia barretti]